MNVNVNNGSGKKLRLRAMEPEDLDILFEIENDTDDWGMGATNVPYSKSCLLDYITNASYDIYTDKQVRLMVDNEEGEVVGIVDLVNFSPAHQRAELGIIVKKECRHQGYATSIVRLVCEYGRKVLHLHQIYAVVPESNNSCRELLKGSGFQESMLLKQWLYDGAEYTDAHFFQIFF